ncbi:MAG: ComF family protein [Pseudomonadota bacterium]
MPRVQHSRMGVYADYAAPLVDALLPPICLLCRQRSERPGLCEGCLDDLPRQQSACPRCAIRVADPQVPCGRCQRRAPPYERLVAPLRYAFPVDTVITRMKFGGELGFANPLVTVLSDAIAAAKLEVDIVVPVPLHWLRLARRGFNQAERLSTPLARGFGWAHATHALTRRRATRQQSRLSRTERRKNVARSFVAKHDTVRGKRVLLVDDVATSGATIEAASHALLAAGAKAVLAACVARA